MLLKASLAQYFLQKCYMCFSTEDFVAQTPYLGFAPGPHWGTFVSQTPYTGPKTRLRPWHHVFVQGSVTYLLDAGFLAFLLTCLLTHFPTILLARYQ